MTDVRTILKNTLLDSPLEVEILLCTVLQQNRAYLFAHPEKKLTKSQQDSFQQLITKRVEGIPIAYLTGEREFWSLPLKVNADTLIPRHETERLVELALELIPNQSGIRILDLGTGSGAIALALAQERPHWEITATDYSEKALLVAQENANNLGLNRIHFIHSNWFANIPYQQYHAIISNPPYIAAKDPHLNQGDVQFEPINALVSGQDGLADLQYIIQHSVNYLLPKGLLLLEHGYEQKIPLAAIFNKLGYTKVQCWQDIQGHERVSGGWRP